MKKMAKIAGRALKKRPPCDIMNLLQIGWLPERGSL